MITNDYWSAKIAQAYKNYFGKDIVLTTPNAGYEWIKAIFENDLIVGTSDTTIAENVGIKGQNAKREHAPVGLFVYSKARYATSKNLALKPAMDMEPFAGFYYSLYALVAKSARSPHAANSSSNTCSVKKGLLRGVLTAEPTAPTPTTRSRKTLTSPSMYGRRCWSRKRVHTASTIVPKWRSSSTSTSIDSLYASPEACRVSLQAL